MLQLFIANKNYSSWSLRPWVLMKVLGIEFEERLQIFAPGGNYGAFRQFSPTGRVPVLVDGETSVWDSLAIVEYLAEAYPAVWPEDRAARAFARSASAEMHSGFAALRNVCGMNCGIRVELREVSPALQGDITRIGELWTDGLKRFGGSFLAGDMFTAVDAFFAPVAFRIQTYGLHVGGAAHAYAERLLALPEMQEWYEAAIAETFRDEPHDEENRGVGTWTADYRATA
jgi:glutathione S-transferase